MPRLVTLATYPNEPAALIAQAILRGGGIDSIVSQEAAGSLDAESDACDRIILATRGPGGAGEIGIEVGDVAERVVLSAH